MSDALKPVQIQILDRSGNWLRVGQTVNNSQMIQQHIKTTLAIHKKKTRAVDHEGRVLDIKDSA